MNITVIYHSHTGKTRAVVEKISRQLGGNIIEVVPNQQYSTLSAVTKGCYRALTAAADAVTPDQISLTDSDLVVLASPVWAGKPTPVINGALRSISGGEGKRVFVVTTCGDAKSGDQATTLLKIRAYETGMIVVGGETLDKQGVINETAILSLIEKIKAAGESS
ncbi:MAG: NAD(P)H-dependent oxidoreductase [Methanospirillum sp.]|uniref:flavodoxin family protein n=1 Tax=Methanospirillum sp. TaxID=45200 RepID=UPI00236B61C1|nr:NAD(P)H-dependent oxidoreductase [Methanospirillum sp.]MDD1730254.1 NAD(P)H-dependent oxidoreductase [Methanospirillum sp.]